MMLYHSTSTVPTVLYDTVVAGSPRERDCPLMARQRVAALAPGTIHCVPDTASQCAAIFARAVYRIPLLVEPCI